MTSHTTVSGDLQPVRLRSAADDPDLDDLLPSGERRSDLAGKKRSHSVVTISSIHSDRNMTQTIPHPPEPIASISCTCTDDCRTSVTCPCRQWGGSCRCQCQCSDRCFPSERRNIFNRGNSGNLDLYFGRGYAAGHGGVRASAFFAGAIERAGNRRVLGKRTLDWECLDRLRCAENDITGATRPEKVGGDKMGPFEVLEKLGRWKMGLKGLRKGSENRLEHVRELFRIELSQAAEEAARAEGKAWAKERGVDVLTLPFSVNSSRRRQGDDEEDVDEDAEVLRLLSSAPGPQPFCSLCTNTWEDAHITHHCRPCNVCVDTAQHWHCSRCNLCLSDLAPCSGCGGVSVAHRDGLEDDCFEATVAKFDQLRQKAVGWDDVVNGSRRRYERRKRQRNNTLRPSRSSKARREEAEYWERMEEMEGEGPSALAPVRSRGSSCGIGQ